MRSRQLLFNQNVLRVDLSTQHSFNNTILSFTDELYELKDEILNEDVRTTESLKLIQLEFIDCFIFFINLAFIHSDNRRIFETLSELHVWERANDVNETCSHVTFVRFLLTRVNKLLRATPWKTWKSKQRFDSEQFKLVYAGMYNILVRLAVLLEIKSLDDLKKLYDEKLEINIMRQNNSY
jgi:hypothetical protein